MLLICCQKKNKQTNKNKNKKIARANVIANLTSLNKLPNTGEGAANVQHKYVERKYIFVLFPVKAFFLSLNRDD